MGLKARSDVLTLSFPFDSKRLSRLRFSALLFLDVGG